MTERLRDDRPDGLAVGRYKDRKAGVEQYGAMALVKGKPGLIEILVTECDTEVAARELVTAAMAPYR